MPIARLRQRLLARVGSSHKTGNLGVSDAIQISNPYCHELPSPQTAVELFAGEWSSRLPSPYGDLSGGQAPLFEDPRVRWGVEQFGGVRGMRVLELGPLEGGHTFMLDRMGAAEVTAVEGNRRAFLRCLVVKELLGIPSARFLCGDFGSYLNDWVSHSTNKWDLCLAVGVLYHQRDPVRLIELAVQASDRILLWSHYYDEDLISARPDLSAGFASARTASTAGFTHSLYRHDYGAVREWGGYCGGLNPWTHWMLRKDIIGCIEHFGFDVVGIDFDEPLHPNGPAFCLSACRRQ